MKKQFIFTIILFFGSKNVFAESISRLDSILKKGEISICTTGDYKPYSFKNKNGNFEGIDISMAESLAKSLGAKINWIQTTWKSIMPDLINGKCDISVGGISVTLERQKQAFFSNMIAIDGKIPLVLCENKTKFQTIEQMNQENISVIEPKGGTNEAFVRKNLPNAKLTLSENNPEIFQQLVDKKYDLMITDTSEALYQQKRFPALCAINPASPMQYLENAYLLPKGDFTWKFYVDQWLHLVKANGEHQQIVEKWLATP